jgi:tartrate dehydratase beta subunit/fumarate hydratase class I family protein
MSNIKDLIELLIGDVMYCNGKIPAWRDGAVSSLSMLLGFYYLALQCTYYSLTYRLFSIGHITRTIGAIS